MSIVAADLPHARIVKDKLSERLARAAEVNGIGLMRQPGRWAVKVNLIRPAPHLHIPPQIDGVEIVTEITGPIVAQ